MSEWMNIDDPSCQVPELLMLSPDEVHLWRINLESVALDEQRWRATLSADELERAARFHFVRDRQRFVATRALLRIVLAGYLAIDPRDVTFRYSSKEKPSLDLEYSATSLSFNVSHSGEISLLAFARGRNIGVDVEQVRSDFELDAISRRFFSAHEQREIAALPPEKRIESFFRCWTRKEAYIKATGDGLSLPLSQFDVSLAVGDVDALLATRPDPSEAGRWRLMEVPSGSGYTAAICAEGRDWELNDWSKNDCSQT
jgi:4'-phosphopantetheinyl transferase